MPQRNKRPRLERTVTNQTRTSPRETSHNRHYPANQPAKPQGKPTHQSSHRFPRNDLASYDTRVASPPAPHLSRARISAAHTITQTKHETRQNGTKYMNISESCSRAGRAYAAIHSNIPTDTTNGATTPRQRRRRPRTKTNHVHTPEPTRQPAKTRDSHARTRAQEHR